MPRSQYAASENRTISGFAQATSQAIRHDPTNRQLFCRIGFAARKFVQVVHGESDSSDSTLPNSLISHYREAPVMHDVSAFASSVHQALSSSPHFPGRNLQVEGTDGRVVLKGIVGSYFHKQMAQEAVLRVDGVHDVENQLEVDWR
ncbi:MULTISPECIES: BON domain-containing protein [Pirellulaceae]|nr:MULTISPECIES: BON domain-containing protein [Pirellulaceae]